MNRKGYVAYNLNYDVETERLPKVMGSGAVTYTVKVII